MRSPISSRGLLPGIALVLLSSRASAIRVEIEPMPFPKAAHVLSRLFGAPVRIDKRLQGTTFVAYAPSTTPEELRAKIAGAFNATWTYWNGEWFLEQTETQILQEAEAIERLHRPIVRRFLSSAKVTVRRYESFSADHVRLITERWDKFFEQPTDGKMLRTQFFEDEDFWWIKRELPSGRLLNRLIAQFTAEEFIRLPIGERRVFAWKPLRTTNNGRALQTHLSFDPSGIIADYWTEQQLMSERLKEAPPKEMAEGLVQRIGLVAKPENLIVAISRPNLAFYKICVAVLDRLGEVAIAVENYSYNMDPLLDSDEFDGRFWDFTRQKEQLISLDARDFRKLLPWPSDLEGRSFDAYATKEPDLNLLQLVKRTTERDPLTFGAWELLKMEAQDRGASFVGELSDEGVGLNYGFLRMFTVFQSAERVPNRSNGAQHRNIMRLSDPHWVRKIYRDRRSLEGLLNARSTGKYRNLVEILGDYAEANALVSWNNPLDSLVQRARFEDLPTDGVEPKYWPAYAEPGRRPPFGERWQPAFRNSAFWSRFYKGIAPMLPSIPAADPTDIDVQELRVPQKTRALLEEVLFRSAIPEDILSNFLVRIGSEGGGFSAYGATAEPTLYFPNGLPDDVKFSASSKHRFRLVAEVQNSPKRRWVMGPQQLAEVVYAKTNPKGMKIKNIPVGFSLDRLYLYKQVRLQITIHLGPGFSAIGQVEWHEPVGSKPVPLNLLPKEFQDAYKQELINIQGAPKR